MSHDFTKYALFLSLFLSITKNFTKNVVQLCEFASFNLRTGDRVVRTMSHETRTSGISQRGSYRTGDE